MVAQVTRELTYAEALREALVEEMTRDESVVAYGEDFTLGYVWPVSRGLQNDFGDRIRDVPLCEQLQVGMAVGAAMAGVTCVVEMEYSDFSMLAMDEVVNQAAKLCFMTGGQARTGFVLRLPYGHLRNYAAQHSQTLYALYTHIPGLKVVAPATPADAKGLLKTAIRSQDPVMFFEHKQLFMRKGPVPDGEHVVPLGQTCLLREGGDATVVAIGLHVGRALAAAEQLSDEGIEVAVLDPRTLVPLDLEPIVSSVRETGRLLLVDEAALRGGYTAYIASEVANAAFDHMEAPPRRLGVPDVPIPYAYTLEEALIPSVDQIVQAVRDLLAY